MGIGYEKVFGKYEDTSVKKDEGLTQHNFVKPHPLFLIRDKNRSFPQKLQFKTSSVNIY